MGGIRAGACGLALMLVVAGCTSSPSESSEAEPGSTETTAERSAATATSESSAESSSTDTADPSKEEEPLRPFDSTPPTTEDDNTASAWISRKSMTDSSIELTWSATDGAVEYQVHRLPRTSDEQPAVADMTPENLVHTATESGRWTDEGVAAGTAYWYGIRTLAPDGALLAHGWHRAAAVTDDEPPAAVGELTAVMDDGGVLVTWAQPAENYELHGYRVFRGVDGQEPESISTTWRIGQTSFVDDDPPTGQVTYRIIAFDFHWNDSDPSDVVIDLS